MKSRKNLQKGESTQKRIFVRKLVKNEKSEEIKNFIYWQQPYIFQRHAGDGSRTIPENEQYDCEVTMIAHGGWFLEQHANEPDVRFNILYGHYDYVVLQEHAHPFGPEEKFYGAVRQLNVDFRGRQQRRDLYDLGQKRMNEI